MYREEEKFYKLVYSLQQAGFRVNVHKKSERLFAISDNHDDISDAVIGFCTPNKYSCDSLSGRLVVRKIGFDWREGFIKLPIPKNRPQTEFLIEKIREHNRGKLDVKITEYYDNIGKMFGLR